MFSEFLKERLLFLGVSQGEIARRLNMDRGNFNKLFNGKSKAPMKLSFFLNIALALRIEVCSPKWEEMISDAARDEIHKINCLKNKLIEAEEANR